jgi:hypothetical protein
MKKRHQMFARTQWSIPKTSFPKKMNVLDTKNMVMHGLYLQHPIFTYHPVFTQYCPGKKCNPLVDTHISTFMHQVNVENASSTSRG